MTHLLHVHGNGLKCPEIILNQWGYIKLDCSQWIWVDSSYLERYRFYKKIEARFPSFAEMHENGLEMAWNDLKSIRIYKTRSYLVNFSHFGLL